MAAAAGIGLDGRCGAYHLHRLGDRADLQLQVHALVRVDRYGEFFGHRGLEARRLGLQLIAADLHIEKGVAAVLVCDGGLDYSRGDILQGDLTARYHGLRLVANHSRNGGCIELSEDLYSLVSTASAERLPKRVRRSIGLLFYGKGSFRFIAIDEEMQGKWRINLWVVHTAGRTDFSIVSVFHELEHVGLGRLLKGAVFQPYAGDG